MKINLLHTIRSKPVFLYLLSFFFVWHGYIENYDFVPVIDAAKLIAIYLLSSFVLSLLFWLLYRDFKRANLVAFLCMALFFFFGGMHDTLKKLFPGSKITHYSFILPALAILLLLIIVLLKRRKKPLRQVAFYLNTLFLVLVLLDAGILVKKMLINTKNTGTSLPAGFVACTNCQQPDVYFILADEYAGNTELKDIFHFDDSAFISELNNRNFHVVPDSRSNYNYTPFSLASILNMSYLDLGTRNRNQPDLTYCYETIRDNRLLKFLQYHHYLFYNYSVFDFEGQPARTNETFLPAKTRLITSQTLFSRIYRDISFNLVTRLRSKKTLRKYTYSNLHNNERLYDLTMESAAQKDNSPKFIYTHLMMPHYPYYFDRNGKEQPFDSIVEGNQHHKDAYIEYLKYGNKKLLDLIDKILRSSVRPPIIILMGDHGFRHFREPIAEKYYFLNFMSVHLPSKNYGGFPDSMSAVNLFRAVLNTEFNQRLPFLSDSTTYLKD